MPMKIFNYMKNLKLAYFKRNKGIKGIYYLYYTILTKQKKLSKLPNKYEQWTGIR